MSQPSTMTLVTTRPIPDAVVVKIIGEVDHEALTGENHEHSGLPTDNVLDSHLANSVTEPCKLVIIDLTETRLFPSVAVATIVRFRTLMAPKGISVRLAAGPRMLRLLKLARLEMLITIFADVDSALRS